MSFYYCMLCILTSALELRMPVSGCNHLFNVKTSFSIFFHRKCCYSNVRYFYLKFLGVVLTELCLYMDSHMKFWITLPISADIQHVYRNEGKYPNRGPGFGFIKYFRERRPDMFSQTTGLIHITHEPWGYQRHCDYLSSHVEADNLAST